MSVHSRIAGAAFVVAVLSFLATPEGTEFAAEHLQTMKPSVEQAIKVYVDAAQAAILVLVQRHDFGYPQQAMWLIHFMAITFLWRLACALPWLITLPFRIVASFL